MEWLVRLATPTLGARPISEISAAEILAVLQQHDRRGRHETAKKLRGLIGQVFRFAIATARCKDGELWTRGRMIRRKIADSDLAFFTTEASRGTTTKELAT
jgi:Phage integrase central domain